MQDFDNQLWYSDPPSGTIRSKFTDFCLTSDPSGCFVLKPFQQNDPNQLLEWAGTVIRSRQWPNKVFEIAGAGPGSSVSLKDYNGTPGQMFEYELIGGAPTTGASTQPPQGGGYAPQPQAPYPGGSHQQPQAPYPYPGGQQPQPQQPQGPRAPVPGRREFYILSQLTGKVLEVADANASPGAKLIIWAQRENRPPSQLWYLANDGYLRSCLNDFVPYAADGQQLVLKPAAADTKAQWYFDGSKIGSKAGPCMDVRGGNKNNGAEVIAYKYNKGPNQHWTQSFA